MYLSVCFAAASGGTTGGGGGSGGAVIVLACNISGSGTISVAGGNGALGGGGGGGGRLFFGRSHASVNYRHPPTRAKCPSNATAYLWGQVSPQWLRRCEVIIVLRDCCCVSLCRALTGRC